MRKFRTAFVTGLLVLVPLMATIDILRWFVGFIDTAARHYIPTRLLPFDFWGLGLIISFFFILATGFMMQNYVGTWVMTRFDLFVRKFPLVGGIYSSIKKFMETIFNPSSQNFKQTVMVEFPMEGMFSIGFLTGEPIDEIQHKSDKRLLNIFIPLVPNPISGFYIILPEDKIIPLKISVHEAFKLVMSMGIVGGDREAMRGVFENNDPSGNQSR